VFDNGPRRNVDPPGVNLDLLGGFELRQGAETVELPLAWRRLVAFLGLRRHFVARESAARALWPQTEDAKAHARLRSLIWRIGRSHDIRGLVEATRTHVRLGAHVSVDVRDQVRLVKGVLSGAIQTSEVPQERLIAGELLPDWYDDWVMVERELLGRLRLRALDALAEALVEAGRPGEAAEASFAGLRSDPLRTRSHYMLITSYLAAGNQVHAIRHLRSYSDVLKHTLGLDPPAELEALVAESVSSIGSHAG
jgi:DNA-binding SARP family transcriptional activator